MAYIVAPSDIALAIGAKCAGNISSDNEAMLNVLNHLLPRIEDAMNVASLTHGETTDTFDIDIPPNKLGRVGASLRLSNGYVDATNITVTDPQNRPVTLFTLDARYGVVYLDSLATIDGRYTVTYQAGFAAEPIEGNDEVEVFVDVPEWIKGLVAVLLVQWYRAFVISPKAPENYRFGEIMAPLHQEIAIRVYERYQRPRGGMVFPITSVRTDGMLT